MGSHRSRRPRYALAALLLVVLVAAACASAAGGAGGGGANSLSRDQFNPEDENGKEVRYSTQVRIMLNTELPRY